MTTVKDVWGFSESLAVNADINEFFKHVNDAAKDRGIDAHVPSDALDMSRDIILDEAAQKLGLEWEIVDDTIRLWPAGVTIKWESLT